MKLNQPKHRVHKNISLSAFILMLFCNFACSFSAFAAPIHDAGGSFGSASAGSAKKKSDIVKKQKPSALSKKTAAETPARAGIENKPGKKAPASAAAAVRQPKKGQSAVRGQQKQPRLLHNSFVPRQSSAAQAEAAVYRVPYVPYPRPYEREIHQMSQKYQVPADLIHAVVHTESGYNPTRRGGVGEIGLMQLRPATARLLGYKGTMRDLYRPMVNLEYGTRYLALAHYLSGGTVCGTVLKYNAGHGAKRMNPISARYCQKVKAYLYSVGYR